MKQGKRSMRSLLLVGATATAMSLAGGALAADKKGAKVINAKQDKVKIALSGQISKSMVYYDDGGASRFRIDDSNFSSTRVRWNMTGKISSDLSIAGLLEIAMDDARNNITDANYGARSGNDTQTRHAKLDFKHKSLGTFSIGSSSTAADGINNMGTPGFVFLTQFTSLMFAGKDFRVKSDGSLLGATNEVGDVLTDLDYGGREPRLRYDTPNFMGFSLAASHSDDTAYELALRYKGKFLDSKVGLGIGYHDGSAAGTNGDRLGGTVYAQHSSGLGVTASVGWTNQDTSQVNGGDDAHTYYISGYLSRKFNEMGKTVLAVEYQQAENITNRGEVGKAWGAGIIQHVSAANLELYAKYANFDRDGTGIETHDIDAVMIGSRMKF